MNHIDLMNYWFEKSIIQDILDTIYKFIEEI